MRHIILIACGSKKLVQPARAGDLYISPLFQKSKAYAESLRPDAIYILSARHGLLAMDSEIAPYNITLNQMSRDAVREWATGVLEQLRRVADLQADHFTFLAGARYRRELLSPLAHYSVPMAGLGIGRQLMFLTEAISSE